MSGTFKIGLPSTQRFAAGQLFATAILTMRLRMLDPNTKIIVERTDAFTVDLDLIKAFNALIGVGGKYDPTHFIFDPCADEDLTRIDGTKYHLAGALWMEYGRTIIRGLFMADNDGVHLSDTMKEALIARIHQFVDDKWMKSIDAESVLQDMMFAQGFSTQTAELWQAKAGLATINDFFFAANPPADLNMEKKSRDQTAVYYNTLDKLPALIDGQEWGTAFIRSLDMVRLFLGNYLASVFAVQLERLTLASVRRAYAARTDPEVLIIEDGELLWERPLLSILRDEEVKIVILNRGKYFRIYTVPVAAGELEKRVPFPPSWFEAMSMGANGPAFSTRIGVPDIFFVNPNGHYAGAKTLEAAIAGATTILDIAAGGKRPLRLAATSKPQQTDAAVVSVSGDGNNAAPQQKESEMMNSLPTTQQEAAARPANDGQSQQSLSGGQVGQTPPVDDGTMTQQPVNNNGANNTQEQEMPQPVTVGPSQGELAS